MHRLGRKLVLHIMFGRPLVVAHDDEDWPIGPRQVIHRC